MPTKKARSASAVKLSSSPAVPNPKPKLALAEAKRSAALHAARAAKAEIWEAEHQLRFMAELGGLIAAIRHRYERRRAYLEEAVMLGREELEGALEDLRGAELCVENAGGAPLTKDTEVEPFAPGPEVAELLALARRGGAR